MDLPRLAGLALAFIVVGSLFSVAFVLGAAWATRERAVSPPDDES